MLYGSLAASPQVFRGMDGQMATFFFFPEVCVRVRGRYRLRATLMRLPSTAGPTAAPPAGPRVPQVGAAENDTATDASTSGTRTTNTGAASASISTNAVLATVQTSPFTVHLASDYTAPYVTDVTRFFARQGAALPLPSGERID